MSPRKLLIQALAAVLLAAPAALADEAVPGSATPTAGAPEGVEAPALPAADLTEPTAELAPDPTLMAEDDGTVGSDASPSEAPAALPTDMDDAQMDAPADLATDTDDAQMDASADLATDTDEPSPVASQDSTPVPDGEEAFDTHPPLGAIGYDSDGHRGRIHIVVRGDTLWDISDAYLGTPWVWPSIWHDNGEIKNPHLIYPGDHIWITPSEMRKISPEEAAAMLSNLPPEQPAPAAAEEPGFEEPETPPPAEIVSEPVERGSVIVSSRESAGLITPAQLQAAASIVGRVPERVMVAQEDDVYIGLGEGDVSVGDQLTVFRTHEKVFDPDTGVLLGYHVEFLGWVQVNETYAETSKANIRRSLAEIQEGDRLIPREPLPQEIPLQVSPAGVEGKISFFPHSRVVIGAYDYVYLNRGSVDGLEVGSPLEVYRVGRTADEETRGEQVLIPDRVVARLVVVRTEEESAVAMVMNSKTELTLGDRFRGANL